MKIDLHKLSNTVIQVGGPIVLAALAHKVATGRFDVKAAVLDAAEAAIASAKPAA